MKNILRYKFRNEQQKVSKYLPENISNLAKIIDSFKCYAINSPYQISNFIFEHETKHNIKYLSEGLIKTYPTQKFIDWFKSELQQNLPIQLKSLKFSDIENTDDSTYLIDVVDKTSEIDGISGQIAFIVPFYKHQNFKLLLDKLVNRSYIFGYDFTSLEKYDQQLIPDVDVFLIQFEARFANAKFELADVLLHISPLRSFEKIKKHGLVPKSKSTEFRYMDRIYLFNQCSQKIAIEYGLYKMNQVNDNGFCVFKINKKQLINDPKYKNGKLTFYIDTSFSDNIDLGIKAIFTYNNINLNLLDDTCLIFNKNNINFPKTVKFK